MKIARYIGDLLYDYECVVIPGLGGFLAEDKPASIQRNTHYFRPPFKQVMFNAYLKTNDGLLVNYIAREENISYKEAKAQVDKFVYLCNEALQAGKRIHFHKVGTIYINKHDKIVFEQDNTVNYNADAFGLTGFVSPVVKQNTPEEKLHNSVTGKVREKKSTTAEEKVKQNRKTTSPQTSNKRKPAYLVTSRKKSPYRTQLAFLVSLIIAMMIGWGFMNKDMVNAYYNNYSSLIPLFYTQSNAYVVNNIDKVPITRMSNSHFGSWWIHLFEKNNFTVPETDSKSKSETTVAGKPARKLTKPKATLSVPVVKHTKNTVSAPVITTAKTIRAAAKKKRNVHQTATMPAPRSGMLSSRHYYIIAGAFKSPHNVRSLIYSLQKKGYHAMAVGVTPNGFHRVAFGVFSSRTEAEKQLQKIRRQENPAAWILVN